MRTLVGQQSSVDGTQPGFRDRTRDHTEYLILKKRIEVGEIDLGGGRGMKYDQRTLHRILKN